MKAFRKELWFNLLTRRAFIELMDRLFILEPN